MTPHDEWTLRAESDLEEIVVYIAVEDQRPATAAKIAREIKAKCAFYAKSPLLGTAAPELGQGCRYFCHKRWVVIFRPAEFGIQVLGVVDSARDFPAWHTDH